jgi:hypothetical protein
MFQASSFASLLVPLIARHPDGVLNESGKAVCGESNRNPEVSIAAIERPLEQHLPPRAPFAKAVRHGTPPFTVHHWLRIVRGCLGCAFLPKPGGAEIRVHVRGDPAKDNPLSYSSWDKLLAAWCVASYVPM